MKKLLCSAVAVLVVVSCFCVCAAALDGYEIGDVVEYGSYPQTQVTDEKIIKNLMGQELDWKSYGYYCSYDGEGVASMRESDFSMYADVELDGEKYRAVRATEYFPDLIFDSCPSESEWSYFETDTIYWFKYEPIEWVVLDPEDGLLLSKNILDSRPFHFKTYTDGFYLYGDVNCETSPADYSASDIREWLNNDFYNTAFTDKQKKNIKKTDLVDDSRNTDYFENDYAVSYGKAEQDSVYLLSFSELINPHYGFYKNSDTQDNDPARKKCGTDYAKMQGLYVCDDEYGTSAWYTRTSIDNCLPIAVEEDGGIFFFDDDYATFVYGTGICPAIRVSSLSVGIFDSVDSFIKNEGSTDGDTESNGEISIVGLFFIVIAVSAITSVITACVVKHKPNKTKGVTNQ